MDRSLGIQRKSTIARTSSEDGHSLNTRLPPWGAWSDVMCSGSEAGSYLRFIDSCITQLKAQEPSRTCNESKEEDEDEVLTLDSGCGGRAGGRCALLRAGLANHPGLGFTKP